MIDLLPFLIEQLQEPDYLHLVLQSFLIQGLFLCAVFVLGSLIFKQKISLAIGLILMALCAGCIYPYLQFRAEASTAIQLAQGEHQATEIESIVIAFNKLAWIYYALGGVALLAAVTIPAKNKLYPLLSIVAVIWALYASGLALAYHHRDSRLYHPNLKAPGEVVEPPKETPEPSPIPPSDLPASQNTTPTSPQSTNP